MTAECHGIQWKIMSGGVPCSDVAFNMITLAVDGDLRKKQGKCISKETGWKAVAKTQIRYYSGLDWGGSSRARRRQLVWDVALRWCQQDFRPSAPSCKSPSPSDTALRKLNSFSCLRKFSSLLILLFLFILLPSSCPGKKPRHHP